jgi:N-acetylneuraminic acid mutarotase
VNKIILSFIVLLSLYLVLDGLPNVAAVEAENSWVTIESMPTPRAGIGVAAADGKIYAIGGSYDSFGETEQYDPTTNIWTKKTPMPTPRILFGIAVVENKIYTIGGDGGNWTAGETPTNMVEVYTPATDTWETKASMNINRIGLSASVVEGKIYVIGGKMGALVYGKVSATEVYDPLTNTWTIAKQIPTPVGYHASAVVDHKIYIIGGSVGLALNQIYDTRTDTWSIGASLPVGVDSAAAGVIADALGTQKIYVIGGKQNLDATNLTQVYDPATDSWSTAVPMPTARYMLGATIINDTLYAIGGREGWFGSPISGANEKFTPLGCGTFQPTPTSSPSFSPSPSTLLSPTISPLESPIQTATVPEFPAWIILPLFIIGAALLVARIRRRT